MFPSAVATRVVYHHQGMMVIIIVFVSSMRKERDVHGSRRLVHREQTFVSRLSAPSRGSS